MKANKYNYLIVIQQFYGQSWEDVSEYEADSQYRNFEKSGSFYIDKRGIERQRSLIAHDIAEYRFTGYPTRIIHRKELKQLTTSL